MRKITYILMILFIIVLMSACNWVDSDAAFKKAIDEAKPINAETIDSVFMENEGGLIPEEFFTNMIIDNTNISIKSDQVESNVYIWQDGNKIYLNSPVSEFDITTETNYIDLSELEVIYDEAMASLDTTETLKPSDIYSLMISEYKTELGLAHTVFEKRSLDELLEILNYKSSDFVKVSAGKYKVKNDVLYAKLLKWSLQDMTVEQFIELLSQSNVQIHLYAYFDGEKVTAYEVVIANTVKDVTEEAKAKISFIYTDEKLSGVKLELFVSSYEVSLEMKIVEEDGFVVDLVFNVPSIQKMVIHLEVSSEKLEFYITDNDIVLLSVNLNYSVKQENSVIKFTLSGVIKIEDTIIVITNGTDVIIPPDVLSTKDDATNILNQSSLK